MNDITKTPTVDDLVEATPATRERVVDFTRVLSIAVVVLWHWVFSITQWDKGRLVMPNLISHVRGLWLATWVLQIMPAFFIVGGYANLASWDRIVRQRGGAREFWQQRLRRLLRPALAMMAIWAVVDLALVAVGGLNDNVLRWGIVTFVPLWFLGAYSVVVLAVPITARLHHRYGVVVPIVMVMGMAVAGNGYVTTALVWLFAHQLGYFWRDGRITHRGTRRARVVASRLLIAGVSSLVLLTTLGGYPDSMVATTGGGGSNMFPTSICIAALAVLQLGLLLLARPYLDRWLKRRRVWRLVVAANGISMTLFCWHMTALIIVIGIFSFLGGQLLHSPSALWWVERPFWLLAPGIVLAGLVWAFSRIERSRS
jgi:peptidoglycan/LPS O-acetylase OafA/YrhL